MANPVKGNLGRAQVCATVGGSYQTIGGLDKIDPKGWFTPQAMDASQMEDTAPREAAGSFKAPTLACSGKFIPGDAGQALLLPSPFGTNTTGQVYVKYSPDGGSHYSSAALCSIKDLDPSHAAGGAAASLSFSLAVADGAAPTFS